MDKTNYPIIRENNYPTGEISAVQLEKTLIFEEAGVFLFGWKSDLHQHIQTIHFNFSANESVCLDDRMIHQWRDDIHLLLLELGSQTTAKHLGFHAFLPWPKGFTAKNKGTHFQLKVIFDNQKVYELKIPSDFNSRTNPLLESHLVIPLLESITQAKIAIPPGIGSLINANLEIFLKDKGKDFHLTEHQSINTPVHINIDKAMIVPEHGLFLSGWNCFDCNCISEIYLCSTGKLPIPVLNYMEDTQRSDINKKFSNIPYINKSSLLGFSAFIKNKWQTTDYKNAFLQVILNSGEKYVLKLQFAATTTKQAVSTIQQLVIPLGPFKESNKKLFKKAYTPILNEVWKNKLPPQKKPEVKIYGEIQHNPEISIIVPLFGRLDLMQHQLAHFADDKDIKNAELIFILDDPSLYNDFNAFCIDNFPIFKIPFVTIYNGQNLGFSGANNYAAKMANGRYLLLLNSDVIPKQNNWLSNLLRSYQKLSNPGAIAPKLLYSDQSIQHAGISFERFPQWDNLWINEHPLKGYNSTLKDEHLPQVVDAVTAACLFLERELFLTLGGFDESYIIGDFEDSDLCLKIRETGKKNYYIPNIELYHLERKSLSQEKGNDFRTYQTYYNCLYFNKKWRETLDCLKT